MVQQIGRPQEVYDNPVNLFVAKFLGTPPIHVFDGRTEDGKLYIGGAAVLDGRLYTGSHFGAGEFGHMITHAGGLPCGCGQRGCFERYASASALVRQAQRLDPSLDSGRAIFRRLKEPQVKAVVDSWLREIVYGLASLIHLWDPDCLALCGGVMQQSYPVEQLKALVPKSVMPAYRSVSIQAAQLGNQAGLLGAAELARRLAAGQLR